MRTPWTIAAAAFAVFTLIGTVQAEEGTAAQRAACKPDVYRYCKWYIPSHSGILYCLHQNIDKISKECRDVLEGRLR
jgi:hypothetical protein